MAYEIKMDDPALPKGAIVTVDGLGNLTNKATTVVSTEQHEAFRTHNSKQTFDHDENGSMIITTEKGPTLVQAFKDSKTISVKEVKDANPTLTTDPVVPDTQDAPAEQKEGE